MIIPLIIVVAAGVLAIGRRGGKPDRPSGPAPKGRGVEMARGGNPIWPIVGSRNARFGEVAYRDNSGKAHGNIARAFRASRAGGERYHAGIDLYADPGDIVVAPEDGVIVAAAGKSDPDQTFYAGTDAVLLELDSGIVVLLGETLRDGVSRYGHQVGSRLRRGQPVTEVGLSSTGSHMLHVETYRSGTTRNRPWYQGRSAPSELLDPTDWLLRAKDASGV